MLSKKIILFTVVASMCAQTVMAKGAYYSKRHLANDYTSWALTSTNKNSSIQIQESWKLFSKKKDIVVAVIDTGIQFDHPFLKDNLFVPKVAVDKKHYGIDFSEDTVNLTPNDTHGHGTHVSGIIKSIFPEVKILPLKYYNPKASGSQNVQATIKALKYAVDQKVDIINYSSGGAVASSEEKEILREAQRKGILVITAAGNERSDIDKKKNEYFPASYNLANIISVSAHNQYNEIIDSSNWGQNSVSIAAPGKRIKSSIPGARAGYMTGTSQATAFVTGVAALIKAGYPKLNFLQIKNIILSSAKKLPSLKGKVQSNGKLDAANALRYAKAMYKRLFKRAAILAKK